MYDPSLRIHLFHSYRKPSGCSREEVLNNPVSFPKCFRREADGGMAKQEKIRMPAGIAGIVRYFDEKTSSIELTPEIVVGVSAALAVGLFILNLLS